MTIDIYHSSFFRRMIGISAILLAPCIIGCRSFQSPGHEHVIEESDISSNSINSLITTEQPNAIDQSTHSKPGNVEHFQSINSYDESTESIAFILNEQVATTGIIANNEQLSGDLVVSADIQQTSSTSNCTESTNPPLSIDFLHKEIADSISKLKALEDRTTSLEIKNSHDNEMLVSRVEELQQSLTCHIIHQKELEKQLELERQSDVNKLSELLKLVEIALSDPTVGNN